jgi:branched-chain amino acid transport system ATP-binding protein
MSENTMPGLSESTEPVLELVGVDAFYDRVQALHGISLQVGEREMVALLGANGAGKSTILRSISRTVRTAGEIRFRGRELGSLATHRVASLGVGHVPEGRGTFIDLTVMENLRLGVLARGRRDRDRVDEDLDAVLGLFPILREFQGRIAGALSGGQQQMLAIARALLGRPRLLLVDEPSLGLAPLITREIFETLKSLQEDWDLSVVLAEQNVGISLSISDRAYVLESGRIVASGSSRELQHDEAVQQAYLGSEK